MGTGIRFDGVARPSEHAWKEFWDKAEPTEARATEQPSRARASWKGRVDMEEVRALCASTFPDIDDFKKFLKEHGYEAALRAVPPNLSEEAYRDGLLRALDRRNLIDDDFFKALRDAGGRTGVPADEPAVEAHAAAADEPSLLLSPRETTAAADPPGIPAHVVADLLKAVEGSDDDVLSLIAVGSPWRSWLVGPDDKPQTLTETIERLARDPSSDATRALTWLAGKLIHMATKLDPEQSSALTRAYANLAPSVDRGEAALAPLLPTDSEFTDMGFLARGIEAGRAVFVVQGPAQPGRASFYGGTGWLLTSALVVVPAHLVEGPNDARDWDAAAERVKSFVARFDFDAPDSIGMTIPVQKLELLDHKLDLAILRLRTEVTDRAPLAGQSRSARARPGIPVDDPSSRARTEEALHARGTDHRIRRAPGHVRDRKPGRLGRRTSPRHGVARRRHPSRFPELSADAGRRADTGQARHRNERAAQGVAGNRPGAAVAMARGRGGATRLESHR